MKYVESGMYCIYQVCISCVYLGLRYIDKSNKIQVKITEYVD